MKGFSMLQRQKNRIMIVLALVLIAALLIPQFSWAADNVSDVPLACTEPAYAGHEAACSHYFDLLELYRTGQLEYHAPGR